MPSVMNGPYVKMDLVPGESAAEWPAYALPRGWALASLFGVQDLGLPHPIIEVNSRDTYLNTCDEIWLWNWENRTMLRLEELDEELL